MKVTINKDEISASDMSGNLYKIKGILIKKPDGVDDVFYGINTSFCKACIYKGLKFEFTDNGNNEITIH